MRYYKEIGVWKPEHQSNNDKLIERQKVLQTAWTEAKSKESGGDDFLAFWMGERAKALKAAGMDPVWDQ